MRHHCIAYSCDCLSCKVGAHQTLGHLARPSSTFQGFLKCRFLNKIIVTGKSNCNFFTRNMGAFYRRPFLSKVFDSVDAAAIGMFHFVILPVFSSKDIYVISGSQSHKECFVLINHNKVVLLPT